MMHVPQAQKLSDKVSSRQLRRRTRKIQAAGSATSKGQMDIHMIRHLRKKSKEERKALMKKVLGHELVYCKYEHYHQYISPPIDCRPSHDQDQP